MRAGRRVSVVADISGNSTKPIALGSAAGDDADLTPRDGHDLSVCPRPALRLLPATPGHLR